GKLGGKEGLEGIGLLSRQGKGVQDDGAADGNDGRKLAQDGPVPRQKQQRFSTAKLGEGSAAGLEFVHAVQRDFSNRFRAKGVEMDASGVLERPRVFEKRELDLNSLRGFEHTGGRQGHAARQFVELHSGKIQSCTLAGKRLLGLAAVHLYPAYARPF